MERKFGRLKYLCYTLLLRVAAFVAGFAIAAALDVLLRNEPETLKKVVTISVFVHIIALELSLFSLLSIARLRDMGYKERLWPWVVGLFVPVLNVFVWFYLQFFKRKLVR